MSNSYLKTKYYTEGSYGSLDEETLYVSHNRSSDYVTFYDSNGNLILTVPDTIDNNILDAINRLYSPYLDNVLIDGVEIMNIDEIKKI